MTMFMYKPSSIGRQLDHLIRGHARVLVTEVTMRRSHKGPCPGHTRDHAQVTQGPTPGFFPTCCSNCSLTILSHESSFCSSRNINEWSLCSVSRSCCCLRTFSRTCKCWCCIKYKHFTKTNFHNGQIVSGK